MRITELKNKVNAMSGSEKSPRQISFMWCKKVL